MKESKSISAIKRSDGPQGPAPLTAPKTRIITFDWSPKLVDQPHPAATAEPDALEIDGDDERDRVDREFDRFFSTCVANPNGRGVHDPSCTPAELAMLATPFPTQRDREILAKVPGGWTAGSWTWFLRYMSDACHDLNPDKSAGYAAQAGVIEGVLS